MRLRRRVRNQRSHRQDPASRDQAFHLSYFFWSSCDSVKNSDPLKKLESRTVEFVEQIPPDGEKTLTYKVHYSC